MTYLSLNEARRYCNWLGKRLPHSFEWQWSAQGDTLWLYPWGNINNQSNYPKTSHNRTIPGAINVNMYEPMGNSLFGVTDLIGNVWQYTDEFYDIHTRAVCVKGSSNYHPTGDCCLYFCVSVCVCVCVCVLCVFVVSYVCLFKI